MKTDAVLLIAFVALVVGVVTGHLIGYNDGHGDGFKSGHALGIQKRSPTPPATICAMKMPSSKYRQLDCVRHAWRK